MLQNPDICQEVNILLLCSYACTCIELQVFKRRSNETQYMYDFSDGEVYKNHALFSSDNSALQVIIYTHEVETADPLGSYRGQHKLS